ncbi:RNA-binding S4 domain-containing protein [Baekduia sp. Peel2402]|uniref:RNA-binding S4 domain-containing protein n=1 Tax=Baekduia sp. Peel2402 TaxID=3458296 RepID=UPI00403EC823
MHDASAPVRVDKWLWAARLVKTRALGSEAAKGGRVEVNGVVVKPSKDVKPGDELVYANGPVKIVVRIKATAERRGSAAVAATLFDETPESVAAREAFRDQRRLELQSIPRSQYDDGGARPTKRDRRRFDQQRSAARQPRDED